MWRKRTTSGPSGFQPTPSVTASWSALQIAHSLPYETDSRQTCAAPLSGFLYLKPMAARALDGSDGKASMPAYYHLQPMLISMKWASPILSFPRKIHREAYLLDTGRNMILCGIPRTTTRKISMHSPGLSEQQRRRHAGQSRMTSSPVKSTLTQ